MFQFPASPVVGQTYSPIAGVQYRWNGTGWVPYYASTLSRSDRLINGRFAVDQRRAGGLNTVTLAAGNSYGPDRWLGNAAGGSFTMQTFLGSSNSYILGVTSVTPDTIGPTKRTIVQQNIEGYHVDDMHLGQADASGFTFAFEVLSDNYLSTPLPVSFRNALANVSYVAMFQVNAINTWETKVFNVPAVAGGTSWDVSNGVGLSVSIGLMVGSTYWAGSLNTWLLGNFFGHTTGGNFMAVTPNHLYFRNMRLYAGAVDLGPTARLYAEELALSQRYYAKSYSELVVPGTVVTTGQRSGRVPFAGASSYESLGGGLPQSMRVAPTVVWLSPVTGASNNIRNVSAGADIAVSSTGAPGALSTGYPSSGGSGGNLDQITAHWTANAEF